MSNRTIRHACSESGAALDALVAPRAEAAPELGPLLSVLFAQLDAAQSMVLHVTSATPGAGTSTVARDIAAGAASSGWCSVALVDAHPPERRGPALPGMVEQVERGEEPSLRRSRVGAAQIDSGVLSSSGRAVSRLESVRGVYGMLRRRYSLTVVDCPAVFSGQQLTILASAADETILVLEAERSNLGGVARAREALEQRGASVLGVVMNKSRRRIPKLLDGLL